MLLLNKALFKGEGWNRSMTVVATMGATQKKDMIRRGTRIITYSTLIVWTHKYRKCFAPKISFDAFEASFFVKKLFP